MRKASRPHGSPYRTLDPSANGSPVRSPYVPLAIAVAIVLAGTALFTAAIEPEPPAGGAPAPASIEDATVSSFDETPIRVTVFRPAGVSSEAPVPVILHSHGWSGSRATSPTGVVGALVDAGYGVVSIDARGHGESGGYANVHHQDVEVRDFQAVLDWIHDNLGWVRKEPGSGVPKDVVAGGAGYSYAGGFQLMTASHDARLDALVPEITWNFLPEALAPGGAVKSAWVDALYGLAKGSGTRIDPRIDGWYREAMATNAFPADAYEHFVGSSPRPEDIRADVLLVQGIPDVLFNLNQAAANYRALEAAGAGDVRLFTHLTGHVVPLQPVGTGPDRRMPYETTGPCGDLTALTVAWFDEHLRGLGPSGIPEVSFALDNGECLALDAFPETLTPIDAPALTLAPGMAGSVLVPLLEGPAVVAGIPRLTAEVSAVGIETRAYAGLVIVGADGFVRIVDDQTQPLALVPGETLDSDLVGVAARLGEGDRLLLRIDGLNEWSFHNGARAPGGVVLTDVVVGLPLL